MLNSIKTFFLKISLVYVALLTSVNVTGQINEEKFGKGNQVGVTVSSSDEQNSNQANHTLSGTGYFPDLAGASRFLGQASLGANYEEIEYVSQLGIANWIDEQMMLPHNSYMQKSQVILDEINSLIQQVHPGEVMDRPGEITSCLLYTSDAADE